MKSNLPSKIGFYCSNSRTYLTSLYTKPSYELLGKRWNNVFRGTNGRAYQISRFLIADEPN